MNMSMSVQLLRDRDDPDYQMKLKVLKVCNEAGILPPPEVLGYFGGNIEDYDFPLKISFKAKEYLDEMKEGLELDISSLPSGVSTIRFICSY